LREHLPLRQDHQRKSRPKVWPRALSPETNREPGIKASAIKLVSGGVSISPEAPKPGRSGTHKL
jgi:hypothetical protein